jgi:hypothetical protein
MQLSNIAGKISIKIVMLKLQIKKKRVPNVNYLGSLFSSQHRKRRLMQILQQSDLQKL